jgi:hypothetical protein
MANLLVGVTGDFVPASEVLRPQYILGLVAAAVSPKRRTIIRRVFRISINAWNFDGAPRSVSGLASLSPAPAPLPPIDPDSFRSVLGRFASGVTVLTTSVGNTDVGMTVSSFCSLSLQPPLVLACVARTADLHDMLPRGQRVVFNILSASQEALSRRFSEEEGSRRFDGPGVPSRGTRHRGTQ